VDAVVARGHELDVEELEAPELELECEGGLDVAHELVLTELHMRGVHTKKKEKKKKKENKMNKSTRMKKVSAW
jgi:hypothetical protein